MHYSLKKRLIWGTSIFSVILGCILIFSAYKVALQEVDEILDTQMKYLAERTAEHPLKTVSSKFDFHKTYHEEDLFIDIWAYKDQAHLSHHLHLLVPPVEQAGFYSHKTAQGIVRTYVLP
ncbi:TPA: two-component sensor histidine kinase, partial [Acinetobacter baumannii]